MCVREKRKNLKFLSFCQVEKWTEMRKSSAHPKVSFTTCHATQVQPLLCRFCLTKPASSIARYFLNEKASRVTGNRIAMVKRSDSEYETSVLIAANCYRIVSSCFFTIMIYRGADNFSFLNYRAGVYGCDPQPSLVTWLKTVSVRSRDENTFCAAVHVIISHCSFSRVLLFFNQPASNWL